MTGSTAGAPTRAPASPDGDAPTRDRVARTILENGPSTAADLAGRLDLTPAAVRRHLEHLLAEGIVESREQKVYGTRGRGRPARVFALTEAGRDSFDQQYDDLAVQAMRFLAETQGEDAVVEFARRRVAFVERDYAVVTAADPDLTPAEALARVFTQNGYAASVRDLPVVGEQLCQQHCPVSHVAHEFPQLCEAETEAIASVLGTHVQRLATIAHGDGVCTTCIPQTLKTDPQTDPKKEQS
ncbi:transcriptional regulator [Nocardioides sp. S5]|uniref:helix-turn-helix transcriptional regulator n=1 Tax=Nocardioides sp. S5 TaxID=2017486 RepID=UPI001A8E662B|nr:transcriptional regulator [Nocardioides sp. S5]